MLGSAFVYQQISLYIHTHTLGETSKFNYIKLNVFSILFQNFVSKIETHIIGHRKSVEWVFSYRVHFCSVYSLVLFSFIFWPLSLVVHALQLEVAVLFFFQIFNLYFSKLNLNLKYKKCFKWSWNGLVVLLRKRGVFVCLFFFGRKKHKNEMEKRKRKICSIGFNLGLVFI